MADLSLIRHQSIFDTSEYNPPIHIIGAGATGSRIWLALVELGLTNISIYDFDDVEAHNLANQIYLNEDIGSAKIDACYQYYYRKTGHRPPKSMQFINAKVGEDSGPLEGIVFLLTDTMASRKEIFEACIRGKSFLMIETRMASSYGDIKTVNPFNDVECLQWDHSLVSDDDAEVSACGSSISVGPTASVIANMAVWQMIHFLTDQAAMDTNINIHLKPFMLTL